MALSRWDDNEFFSNPFRTLLDPRFAGPSFLTAPSSLPETVPIKVDVLEKEDKFVVKADVPGVTKDKLNLSLDGDLMTLSVEDSSQQEKEENLQGYKVHRLERTSAYTRRVIRLPDSADTEKITANMDHGVLEVDVPKKQSAQQRKRQIAVGGQDKTEKVST